MKTCEERVRKLLEMTPPRGKDFLHSIEHILEREKNWVSIKVDFALLCGMHLFTCSLHYFLFYFPVYIFDSIHVELFPFIGLVEA